MNLGIGRGQWPQHLIEGHADIRVSFFVLALGRVKGNAKMSKKAKKFEFKGFINVDFSVSDLVALDAAAAGPYSDLDDCLVVLTEAGFKVGFSHDDYHGVCNLALTCRSEYLIYFGHVFMFHHSSPTRLLQAARLLYDEKLKNELYEVPSSTNKYDW